MACSSRVAEAWRGQCTKCRLRMLRQFLPLTEMLWSLFATLCAALLLLLAVTAPVAGVASPSGICLDSGVTRPSPRGAKWRMCSRHK